MISNRSIWHIDGTLTGSTSPGQSGPCSNSNEEVTPKFSVLQNWNSTVGVV